MVERGTENPCVGGSIPSLATNTRIFPWAVALVVLVVLAPVAGLYFAADDFEWMLEARRAIARGFPALPADVNGHFRPLVDLGWLVGYSAFGLDPRPYHLSGIALHAIAAALVALAAARALGDGRAGPVAGLLFGVSFSHRTVTTWISAAPDLWLGLAAAAALCLALAPRPWPRAALCAAAAAGLAKETAVVLPLLLLLVAPTAFAGRGLRLGVAAATVLVALPHAAAVSRSAYVQSRFELGWHSAPRATELVAELLLPFAPPGDGRGGWLALRALGALAVLLIVAALAARRMGRGRALCWLLAALLAGFPALLARTAVESRWLYLPWLVLAVPVAAALLSVADLVARRHGPRAGAVLLLVAVGGHVVLHGVALRAKVARDIERQAWTRALVEAAGRNPPPLGPGEPVEVIVPFGAELRFWPVGVMLAVGQEVEVRPIDDRTPPSGGIPVLDAARPQPAWRPWSG